MAHKLRQTQSRAEHGLPSFQPGEYEHKFIFSSLRVAAVLQWLRHICQPDSNFPRYRVSTIYYDSTDRMFLSEKLNSDYLKTKVRIRWYTGRDNTQKTENAWLEIKQKVGAQRQKSRLQLPYSGTWLATLPLEHSILTEEIPRLLSTHGMTFERMISPVFLLTYDRHRFFDPLHRVGVCVDCQIAVSKVNRRDLPEVWPGRIHTAILEVKGKASRLSGTLQPLLKMGCRKVSVSKYLMCYQHMMSEV